jgi:hypothetical protein
MKLVPAIEEECKKCRFNIPLAYAFCPHCGYDQRFPNVIAAKRTAEVDALRMRYDSAVADAKARRCWAQVREFGRVVKRDAKVVIGRPFEEVSRLLLSDRSLYGTYYDMSEAGLRLPGGDGWDAVRRPNEEEIFPGYKEHIRFGNLSLDGFGLKSYGRCFITLRTKMVSHRTSLFEGNCGAH